MRDKRQKQETDKNRHKQQLKASKRQKSPDFSWGVPNRREKQRILIVCEGENTEPSYFRQFRLTSAEIIPLGIGNNTMKVVERALEEKMKKHYDQIWVVFDKDDFLAEHFNEAIRVAEKSGIGVAYSNQSFEYWLILHFEDHQGGGMHRSQYLEKISLYLQKYKIIYEGKTNKSIKSDFFNLLLEKDSVNNLARIDNAVTRAKRNYDKLEHRSPANEESSTTVFRLVEEINKFL
jgi:RloB-like protein